MRLYSMRRQKGYTSRSNTVDSNQIKYLGPTDTYKYLGVEQTLGVVEGAVKHRLSQELKHRLWVIWSSELTAKQKIEATNTWAIALYQYYLPLMRWQLRELVELDRLVRRQMRLCKAHYYGASLDRLCLPRKQGGHGLSSFVDIHEVAINYLQEHHYLSRVDTDILSAVVHHQKAVTHQVWLYSLAKKKELLSMDWSHYICHSGWDDSNSWLQMKGLKTAHFWSLQIRMWFERDHSSHPICLSPALLHTI